MRHPMRGLATLVSVGLLLTAALWQPTTAAAFALSGCQMTLTSLDAGGNEIDSAVGGSADATQQDPLRVSWDGTVRWTLHAASRSGGPDSSWHVDAFGLPTPLRGADGSATSDSVRISDSLPFRFSGLIFVSGRLSGPDVSCAGSGWLRVLGDPVSTLPLTVSFGMLLVGLVLLAVGARGRSLPAIVGGMMLGAGGAIAMVSFASLPLGEATPVATVGLGVIVGLAAGWFGRRQLHRAAQARGVAGR